MLTFNLAADQMYGYFTVRDDDQRLVFETWVLVEKDGRSENDIDEALIRAEMMLLPRKTLPQTPAVDFTTQEKGRGQ